MPAPKPSRRRDAGRPRGQHVTDAVLDATLAELAASGLEGLSVERVAQRAQVHKTTVYRRWPTREALIAAALEGLAVDAVARAPDTGSLRGDLLGLLGPVATFLGRSEGRAVARAALAAPAEAQVAELAARRLGAPAAGAIEALVARARVRGEWRDDVPADLVLPTLVGALLHRTLLEHADPGATWLEGVVDLLLRGVAPRDGA
jgi:AcrR family transcriptional regulator